MHSAKVVTQNFKPTRTRQGTKPQIKENGDPGKGGGATKRIWGREGGGDWKTKTENSKKMDALREIEQLGQKVANLDREKAAQIYNKRSDFRKVFCALEDQELKMNADRRSEKVKVRQQLTKMKSSVTKFQRELCNVKPTPEFVEKLKEMMEAIESIINNFKEQQRQVYEDLMREEQSLHQEVTAMEKRIESWAQAAPIINETKQSKATTSSSSSSARNVIADLPAEVAVFERFLVQTGGHRGGWDEYDHGTFLKIRNKFRGKIAFLDEAVTSLPGRTITDVQHHERWYREYLSLMERKKEAIQRWKLVKEAQKEEMLTQAAVGEDILKEEQERKAQCRVSKIEEERSEQMGKLNAWKVQKLLLNTQEEERKLEEERKRTKDYAKEKQRQLDIRNRVQEHLEQKQAEEAMRRLEEETRKAQELVEKRPLAKEERTRFLERDQRKLEERLAKSKEKEEEERSKEKRLAKLKDLVDVRVDRDPSRLYRLTEGWKERQKDTTPDPNRGPVLHIPHRASYTVKPAIVATWIKGDWIKN